MRYPIISEIPTLKEMTTNFRGLNARLTNCVDGQFFDMKNITTQYYPVLSPRNRRSIVRTFENLRGIIDKEQLIWVDYIKTGQVTPEGAPPITTYEAKLFVDGVGYSIGLSPTEKTIAKMGAFVVIFPDNIWFNCETKEHGKMDATLSAADKAVTFTPCKADGTPLENVHDESYYKTTAPKSGDIMRVYDNDGKASFKIYSELTSLWSAITSTYFSISVADKTFDDFKEADGVKISVDLTDADWSYGEKIFVNKEDDGWNSLNGCINKIVNGKIVVVGLINDITTKTLPIKIERKAPEMAFVTECQNRLWGCSKDGHEIYCCKLGDVTNWNYFSGTAIDSYAATVGSDGAFTGAVTYNNNPIFFKEHSYLKVTVSSTGAHSYREQNDRGVQSGSHLSICNVNGVLFYKGVTDVYAYDGSSPISVGEDLGNHRYSDAVCGTINGRYYMSVKDTDDKRILFVYDSTKGMWAKEDNANIQVFCFNKDNLLFVSDNKLYCIDGSGEDIEPPVEWNAESGYIGFSMTGNKYVSKLNVRMSLDIRAYCDMWIQYDNDDKWKHLFNMSGKGTKSFTIPVTIQRCDHFRIRISGKGGCKIYSITKSIEEGSDV